jgi:type IV fimbrial biogenesis protein FimT
MRHRTALTGIAAIALRSGEPGTGAPQPHRARTGPWRRPRGASLVEALMALSVVGVTLGAALPSLNDVRDRQRLQAVAGQLETEVFHARSLAVARNQVLRLSFGDTAGPGCWVLHTGATATGCSCDAQGATTCQPGVEALRSEALPAVHGLGLRANVSAMAFEPQRGTVTPTGTLRLQGGSGTQVHLVVNIMGRVRACTPNGTPGWPGC